MTDERASSPRTMTAAQMGTRPTAPMSRRRQKLVPTSSIAVRSVASMGRRGMALVGASGAVDQVGGGPEAAGSIGSGGGSIMVGLLRGDRVGRPLRHDAPWLVGSGRSRRRTSAPATGLSGQGSEASDPRRRRSRSCAPSQATSGDRGRPLYVLAMAEAYAPAWPMATRSPRRSGGMTASPKASVDSQMGPSTRTVVAPASGSSTGRPRLLSATIGWRGSVQGGPDELGHARVQDETRPLALPNVEDAGQQPSRARHDRTPRLDGQPQRMVARQLLQGLGSGSREVTPESARRRRRPGSPTRHRACRNREARAMEAERREADPEGRSARHRRRRAGSRRGRAGRASAAGRRGRHRLRSRSASSSSVTPNLESPAPTARPAWVSGRNGRVEADQHVQAQVLRSTAGTATGRDCHCQGRGLVGRLDGHPAERRAGGRQPYGEAQVGGRLADALERDALDREARRPGEGDLAAGDRIGAVATIGQLRDERRQAIGLQRVEPDPWVWKGARDDVRVGP